MPPRATATPTDTALAALAEAAIALDARAPDRALGPAIAAWRAYPSRALAELVERISDGVEPTRANVPGDTAKARLANALALLRDGDAGDVPRVFRALANVKIADAEVLATALAKVGPDPRWLRLVVALLRAPPWGVSTSRKLWRIVLETLVAAGDARTAAELRAVDLAVAFRDAWAIAEMTRTIARAIGKARAAAPPADAAIDRACAVLGARQHTSTSAGEALLARIYAEPSDLAARAVYADWLQQHGDPHGEFITLQLAQVAAEPSDARRRREAALIEAHRTAWLGALAPCVDDVRFAGGFPAMVAIDVARAYALAAAPEWATVTELWLGGGEADPLQPALLRSPAMASLRFVGNVASADVAALVRGETRPLRGIGILPRRRIAHALDALEQLRAWPDLRELGLDARFLFEPIQWREMWRLPLLAQLERVRIVTDVAALPLWLADQARIPRGIRTLQLSTDGGWHEWTLELARGGDGRFSRLDARLRSPGRERPASKAADLVERILDELPADALETLAFRTDGARADKGDLAAIRAATLRQSRLVSLEIAGETIAITRAAPAPRVKDVRAAKRAAAAQAAREELERVASALPDDTRAVIVALDFGSASKVTAVRREIEWLRDQVPAAWGDVAFALLGLETVDGDTARGRQRAIRGDAMRLLRVLRPAGAGRRVVALLDKPDGPWRELAVDLGIIPEAELGVLFDWFEARRGKASPRPDEIYYAVIAVASAATSASVRRDLVARSRRKQMRFQQYAFVEALKHLARG